MKYLLAVLLGISLSAHVSANSFSNATITRVLAGPYFGNKVFLTLSVSPSGGPACATSTGYGYVFDGTTEIGKITLSMVLTAHATGQNVSFWGDGTCSLYGNVETLSHIRIQ